MERGRQESNYSSGDWGECQNYSNEKWIGLQSVEKDVRSEDYHSQMCLELRARNMGLRRLELKRGGTEVIAQNSGFWYLL